MADIGIQQQQGQLVIGKEVDKVYLDAGSSSPSTEVIRLEDLNCALLRFMAQAVLIGLIEGRVENINKCPNRW